MVYRSVHTSLPRAMKALSPLVVAIALVCIPTLLPRSTTHQTQQSWSNHNLRVNDGQNHRRLAVSSTTTAPIANQLTVAIMSDRFEGLITTIGGMIRATSTTMRIVLIGDAAMNARVTRHFQNRSATFVTMTVEEAQQDLVAQGINPIWNWDEWHSSSREAGWNNNNTVHVAEWDNLETHAHVLNHLRFYLPDLSALRDDPHVFFIDDDLIIQKDLSQVMQQMMDAQIDPSAGLTCPCNIWVWNEECHHFDFKSEYATILEVSPLYGGRPECTSADEKFCLPKNFNEFLQQATPEGVNAAKQTAWNFGFCLFHLENWKQSELTSKYEEAMKINYRLHEVPETSLVFGLGIPYLAFAEAVKCWDEDILKVRDGFGFIDWDRYEKSFGVDFFSSVDVAHYTGPKKPWAPLTTIEAETAQPWLDLMKLEGLEIPDQLPKEPTKNLFALISSHRSGSEWIMSLLDKHDEVCASGEAQKPETGFPRGAIAGEGSHWLPTCSTKKGCTFGFVLESILDLVEHNLTSSVCEYQEYEHYTSGSLDFLQVQEHRDRICNFVKALGNNYTKEAILVKWVEAFAHEDKNFLGCGCARGSKIKGLKIMVDWLHSLNAEALKDVNHISNLEDTAFRNQKVIRLKRSNLWDRYKSLRTAEATSIWHGQSTTVPLVIDTDNMIQLMKWMKQVDDYADKWLDEFEAEVLRVEYDECRASPTDCQHKMFNFLGVDDGVSTLGSTNQTIGITATSESKDPLDGIVNREEVYEALHSAGFGHFIEGSSFTKYTDLQLLVFETDPLVEDENPTEHFLRMSREISGMNVTHIGQGSTFLGFGSKYSAAKQVLEELPPASLVVISDGRDVLANIAHPMFSHSSLDTFRTSFKRLTSTGEKIVVSAEAQCCIAALSHIQPGDIFAPGGVRTGRVCSSGSPSCQMNGIENVTKWTQLMEGMAAAKGKEDRLDVYLNAGLIAGTATDILQMLKVLDIREDEDDQAVLTAFMYDNSRLVSIDYDQELFGNNRWVLGEEGCMFDSPPSPAKADSRLVHRETGASPLFIHSPGKHLTCHSNLIEKQKDLRRLFDSQEINENEDSSRQTIKRRRSLDMHKSSSHPKNKRRVNEDKIGIRDRIARRMLQGFSLPGSSPYSVATVTSTFALERSVECSFEFASDLEKYYSTVIQDLAGNSLTQYYSISCNCEIICEDGNTVKVTTNLAQRALSPTSDQLQCSVELVQLCSPESNNNCNDISEHQSALDVHNALYSSIDEINARVEEEAAADGIEDVVVRIASANFAEDVAVKTTDVASPTTAPIVKPVRWYPSFKDTEIEGWCEVGNVYPDYYFESDFLFETVEDCCQSLFPWKKIECRKKSIGPIDDLQWYPTLDLYPGGCVNNGSPPGYFKILDGYLFDSSRECCETYYPWRVDECMNPIVDPCTKQYPYFEMYDSNYLLQSEQGYYPDFINEGKYCLKLGDAPEYMTFDFDGDGDLEARWKHQTLEQCCLQYFHYAFDECMGDTNKIDSQALRLGDPCSDPLPERSGKWYVEYYNTGDLRCVKDCVGPEPCHNRPTYFKELYDTFLICCETHLWWDTDCSVYDDNGTQAGWDSLSNEPSNKFFADYATGTCLMDCEPGPFGCARVPPPVALYDTIETCCAVGQSWVDSHFCISRSTGEYSNGWYVDFETERCVEDCNPNDEDCSSPELTDHSTTIYGTSEECCKRLGWIDTRKCIGASHSSKSGETILASLPNLSGKWFVVYPPDDVFPQCVKECLDSSPSCSGRPATPYEETYGGYDECCSKHLWWIENSPCPL